MIEKNRRRKQESLEHFEGDFTELTEKLIYINRVAKVIAGGRRFAFNALVAVGDGEGSVGIGLGKAREATEAVRKATDNARKNIIKVPMYGKTIPFPVRKKFGASEVILRPAAPGTGVIAGGTVRAILEVAGYKDVLTKSLGSHNPHNLSKAVFYALKELEEPKEIAFRRKKKVRDIVGKID